MAEFPEWARDHAHKLHELASQARDCEEELGYVSESVTSIQLDVLARLFVKRMKEHARVNAELLAALEKVLNLYVDLVNSGDCGFWDPEDETPVQEARSALAKARGES